MGSGASAMGGDRNGRGGNVNDMLNLSDAEIEQKILRMFQTNPGKVRQFISIAQATVTKADKELRNGQREQNQSLVDGKGLIENMVNEEFGRSIHAFYNLDNGLALGSGLTGTVIKVKQRQTGASFALKTLALKDQDSKNEDLKTELKIMAQLDHPNVVRLVETFYEKDCVHLVMELCAGGELFDRLLEARRFKEDTARSLIRKIVGVVRFCHERGIVHRDLKLENILFDSKSPDAEMKICDFGLSKRYTTRHHHMLQQQVGTPYYMAPEVLDGQYDEKCDLWSIGVIAYMLLTGKPPFPGQTNKDIMDNVRTLPVEIKKRDFSGCSDQSKHFVKSLLDRNRTTRPSAQQALEHPWFTMEKQSVEAPLESTVQRLMMYSEYPTLKRVALEMVTFNFTPDEIKSMIPEFQKFDASNQGEINVNDFKVALTNLTKTTISDENVQKLFDQMDTDHSGALSWHEFLAACLNSCKMDDDKYLKQAFDHIDKTGTGTIERVDIKRLMGDDTTEEEVDTVFAEVGSTAVDYPTFAKMCHKKPKMRRVSCLTRVMAP